MTSSAVLATQQSAFPPGCTLQGYAALKRLSATFLEELGVSDKLDRGVPLLRIPYRDAAGAEVAMRLRTALEKSPGQDDRFRWEPGSKPLLYGLWLLRLENSVVIVEGESDCHTLWHHSINALGLPGAGLWNERRDAHHLRPGSRPSTSSSSPIRAERACCGGSANPSIRDRVRLVRLDGFKDPSEMHVADPEAFRARWDAAVAEVDAFQGSAEGELSGTAPPAPSRTRTGRSLSGRGSR